MSAAAAEGFPAIRPEARPELLKPGSPVRRVLAEPLIPLYGLPGFLLPLMHPATAAATLKRDKVFNDPDADLFDFARRLRDTLEMISGVAHAGDEADHVAYAMRELHRPMQGEDTLGQPYHAWTRDVWSWNWAAITASYMNGYEVLRGWPSRDFRDQAYLGFIEVGRRFGVLGMPATYDEFLAMWPAERDRVADPRNAGVQTLVGLTTARGLPTPRALRWLPLPLWALASAPIRHFLRVAIMAGLHPEERRMIGFPERPSDEVNLRRHVAFWHAVLPPAVSYRVGLAWMWARSRWSSPAWRLRFSAAALTSRTESRMTTVTTSDGLKLAVQITGDAGDASGAPKPTVLLVHGFPDDHTAWDGVVARLAATHRVVTYDTRGTGASGTSTRIADYRLDQLADDLQRVIDSVDTGAGVHLVGHDWGSVQAWHLITDPAHHGVLSLTSISGPCIDHVPGWVARKAKARRFRDIAAMWKSPLYMGFFSIPVLAPALARLGFVDPTLKLSIAALEEPEQLHPKPAGPSARRNAASIRIYAANVFPRLRHPERGGTDVPVQVLTPRRDIFIPPVTQGDPHPDIAAFEIHEIPGGHWAPTYTPSVVADRIESWVVRHGRPDPAAHPVTEEHR